MRSILPVGDGEAGLRDDGDIPAAASKPLQVLEEALGLAD